MNGLTRFVLKRPITTLMAVLCLIVFGYTSVTSMSLENIPDMEMPVLMVMTTYSGDDALSRRQPRGRERTGHQDGGGPGGNLKRS